jgi:NAD+ kinase
MKKYQLVVRSDDYSHGIAKKYESELNRHGWEMSDTPELIIAIGGDGTMLEAFHKYYRPEVLFVGLHTGKLGFYADWDREEADDLLQHIINNEPRIVEYPLVLVQFELKEGKKEFLALNETIIRSKTLSTFVMEVWINERRFESFRGDGMIISTPSGSTGYNHSVGGSILHPSFEAIQVSELAAINNREFRTLNRSFVLPKHHILDIYPKNPDRDILVGIDGQEYSFVGIERIRAKVAQEKVGFARYRPFPFWQRVREKFLDD